MFSSTKWLIYVLLSDDENLIRNICRLWSCNEKIQIMIVAYLYIMIPMIRLIPKLSYPPKNNANKNLNNHISKKNLIILKKTIKTTTKSIHQLTLNEPFQFTGDARKAEIRKRQMPHQVNPHRTHRHQEIREGKVHQVLIGGGSHVRIAENH